MIWVDGFIGTIAPSQLVWWRHWWVSYQEAAKSAEETAARRAATNFFVYSKG